MPHDQGARARRRPPGRRRARAAGDRRRREAWKDWSRWPWEERAAVFLRAAELLAGPWRDTLNAATMLGQSKTAHQAEIDAACESIDFLRFNVEFMTRIYAEQPHLVARDLEPASSTGRSRDSCSRSRRSTSPRSPANLTSSAALMGNVVVWKPASTAMLSAYYLMRLFQEAGLPDGVINLVYGSGATIGDAALASPHLAGIHFTGSTPRLQRHVADGRRRTWSATATTRGSSARPAARTSSSRIPPPTSTRSRRRSCAARSSTRARSARPPRASTRRRTSGRRCASGCRRRSRRSRMGDVSDFGNFMGAVIDASSFATQAAAIEEARSTDGAEIVVGGGYDDSQGFFVEPTVIETRDPDFRLLRDELFGPVVTTYVYDEKRWERHARPDRLDGALRAHRRGVRRGSRGGRGGPRPAPLRGRQLLRQRQADRRGRRPAAVRRRARLGHERQGGLDVEPDPLGDARGRSRRRSSRRRTTATRSSTTERTRQARRTAEFSRGGREDMRPSRPPHQPEAPRCPQAAVGRSETPPGRWG